MSLAESPRGSEASAYCGLWLVLFLAAGVVLAALLWWC